MPRMLAIAAALATVLTVAACGSAQPSAEAAQGGGSQPAAGAAESVEQQQAQPQAVAGDAAEQAQPEAGASEVSGGAQDGALRSGTLSVAAELDPGEAGLPAHSGASIDDVLRLGAVASWIDAPDTLAISLPASADCWASATEPVAASASQLAVEFVAGECDAFDAARTYTVEVPEGIESGAPLEVEIEGLQHHFTLTLPAE